MSEEVSEEPSRRVGVGEGVMRKRNTLASKLSNWSGYIHKFYVSVPAVVAFALAIAASLFSLPRYYLVFPSTISDRIHYSSVFVLKY